LTGTTKAWAETTAACRIGCAAVAWGDGAAAPNPDESQAVTTPANKASIETTTISLSFMDDLLDEK
jgi:hypothetical protein